MRILKLAQSAVNAVIAAKDTLNDLDSGCGDGDCGSCLSSGATGEHCSSLNSKQPNSSSASIRNLKKKLQKSRKCVRCEKKSLHAPNVSVIADILDSKPDLFEMPAEAFMEFASVAESIMGGTSGAVYSLLFNGIAAEIYAEGGGEIIISQSLVYRCFRAATRKIMEYGGAKRGDRTMVRFSDLRRFQNSRQNSH